ncbi:thiol-disulfide oxidoreductase DCC family protein [Streptomyces sp. NPDC015032]|uniref:thiol-disulfide oxidoreductase DCC family protein n=1 Tax=Streptomyces sp. NPDC015032 TaxID=3364937 RepID=UPI003702695C
MTTGTGGRRPSVERLTVLYDAQCSLCVHLRQWLMKQRQLVPLDLVPAASEEARRRFPGLDHAGTLDEITVIGDRGQIYRGTSAWIVCLWALADHRPRSHWLTTPAGRPFARATVLAAAKYRSLTATPCGDGDGTCAVPGSGD